MNSHRGGRTIPADRSRPGLRPAAEPLESRRLLSGLQLSQIFPLNSNFNENQLDTGGAGPKMITSGPDGNLWFTEGLASQIGMTDAADNVQEFATPTVGSLPYGIAAGPDGNLWFTEAGAGRIGVINPATGKITEFPAPTPGSAPHGIVAGPDGDLWFTEFAANRIGEIDPTTHVIKEFPTLSASSAPEDIAAGPDGRLWFTDPGTNTVGSINPTTHDIVEFAIPTAGSTPWGITTGQDGNLWFTETAADQIGMINPTSHELWEYPVPIASSQPYSITTGPDGDLWFTEPGVNMIGILDTTNHSITETSIPPVNSEPIGIATGPDGNVWMTEGFNSIAVFTPDSLVVTSQPPSPVDTGVGFGLTVSVSTAEGRIDTGYNGPVTLVLISSPDLGSEPNGALGGTLTVAARGGVATFSELTIDRAGTYKIVASAGQMVAVLTSSVAVAPPATVGVQPTTVAQQSLFDPPPTIVAEKVLYYRKLRGQPRHLRGFELDFSQAMDAADAGQAANYTMTQILELHRRRYSVPVDLRVTYDATARSVTLTPVGHPTFPHGAHLVVIARRPPSAINVFPDGIADARGVSLDGDNQGISGDDANFVIAPKGSAISR